MADDESTNGGTLTVIYFAKYMVWPSWSKCGPSKCRLALGIGDAKNVRGYRWSEMAMRWENNGKEVEKLWQTIRVIDLNLLVFLLLKMLTICPFAECAFVCWKAVCATATAPIRLSIHLHIRSANRRDMVQCVLFAICSSTRKCRDANFDPEQHISPLRIPST